MKQIAFVQEVNACVCVCAYVCVFKAISNYSHEMKLYINQVSK